MQIKVENLTDIIFEGDADDFLFENDSDMDLEIMLNELENQKDFSTVNAYNNEGDMVTITKLPLYVD
jgi:hypothetical protein